MCLKPVFISDVFDHKKRDQRNRGVQENFAASGGDRSRLSVSRKYEVTGMYELCQQLFTSFNAE
jgi:hypothetical protein